MAENNPDPSADAPLSDNTETSIITAVMAYKQEATTARKSRIRQNELNLQMYLGDHDFSHKLPGQSTETLPKVSTALEQFSSFVKRALTKFGDWYEVELGKSSSSPVPAHALRAMLDCQLNHLAGDSTHTQKMPFATVITDAVKVGALESLMVFKIWGIQAKEHIFTLEAGEPIITPEDKLEIGQPSLVAGERKVWRLRIDLIKNHDYYPDPTGRGLYEIHSSERDLWYIKERAAEGIYNSAAVNQLVQSMEKTGAERRDASSQGQDREEKASLRKTVVIDEFWGTIVDDEGQVIKKNVFCAVANGTHLIRKPVKNPFWHQESPFIAIPLIRVPFSVWHRALYDSASHLNVAMNEMFNLILDGGLASVWGVKQLRTDDVDDLGALSDGIPYGTTIGVKASLPHNAKVLETVSSGDVPTDAMAVLELLDREFTASVFSNKLDLGTFPSGEVLATEVVTMSQSQDLTIDGIVADIELMLGEVLRKAFLVTLQNIDDVAGDEIIAAMGVRSAFALSQMSPGERYVMFAGNCEFKVNGLSAILSRSREFQKIMAMLQGIASMPILGQAFFKKYSPDKIIGYMMKTLTVSPEAIERTAEETQRIDQEMAEAAQFAQMFNPKGQQGQQGQQGQGAGLSGQAGAGASVPAEVNQLTQPLSGLTGVEQ